MQRAVLVLVLVAASSTVASAGGFVGLGIGTGAGTTGDMNLDANGRSGRLLLGYRFGRFSIEGLGSRYELIRDDGHRYTGTTLAANGKYNFPLGDGFEVFGRLGLERTSLNADYYDEPYDGFGLLVGAGAEYRLPITAVGLSLFVDYSVIHTWLKTPTLGGQPVELTSGMWTLGAMLSF